jgi:hypothetical protein
MVTDVHTFPLDTMAIMAYIIIARRGKKEKKASPCAKEEEMLAEDIGVMGLPTHVVRGFWDYDGSLHRKFGHLRFLAGKRDGEVRCYLSFEEKRGFYPIPNDILYLVAVRKRGTHTKFCVFRAPYEGAHRFQYYEMEMEEFLEFLKKERIHENSDMVRYAIDLAFACTEEEENEKVWDELMRLGIM